MMRYSHKKWSYSVFAPRRRAVLQLQKPSSILIFALWICFIKVKILVYFTHTLHVILSDFFSVSNNSSYSLTCTWAIAGPLTSDISLPYRKVMFPYFLGTGSLEEGMWLDVLQQEKVHQTYAHIQKWVHILPTEEQREEVRTHIDFIHFPLNKIWFESVVLKHISDPFLQVPSHKYSNSFFHFGTSKLVIMFVVKNSSACIWLRQFLFKLIPVVSERSKRDAVGSQT